MGRGKRTLLEARVQIRHPLIVFFQTWESSKSEIVSAALGLPNVRRGRALSEALMAAGYDGVILDYSPVHYHQQEIVVFRTAQIHVVRIEPGF